jgi:LCP family protein required for cell wall assembly
LESGNQILVSIPRDIWISSIKDKINGAYLFGESVQRGKGLVTARAAVEEVVGLPIHYAMLIDFAGFREMVDLVGGIDVDVKQSFTDNLYPIAGKENDLCGGDPEYKCRYESVVFNQGIEHMDGERALKYVRSRHAEGIEGTDISRGQRQQAAIIALKNKLTSKPLLTDTKLLGKLKDLANEFIKTDMPISDGLIYGRIYLKNESDPLTIGLNYDQPENDIIGLFENPPPGLYEGKWVLVPKGSSFSQVHDYIQCSVKEFRDCRELVK